MPRSLICLALLSACSFSSTEPSAAPTATRTDPQLSAELELGAGSQLATNAPRRQFAPAAATIGNVALVAWEDERHSTENDLFGATVDVVSHQVLNARPLVLAPGRQGSPAVAASPTQYLVVYEQGLQGATDLWGVYVQPSGQAGTPFVIANTAGAEGRPTVAFGGGKFMVAWTMSPGINTGGPIWSVRFSEGSPPGTPELTGDGPFFDDMPSVGFDGQQFLLAWSKVLTTGSPYTGCIAVLRIAPTAGSLTASAGSCLAPSSPVANQWWPWVSSTSNGNGTTVVAWQDLRGGLFGSKVYMARAVNGVANALDANGGLLIANNTTNLQVFPRVVPSASSRFNVFWADVTGTSNRLFFWDVPSTGTAFTAANPPTPYPGGADVTTPLAAASNPSNGVAVYAWPSYAGPSAYDVDLFGSSGSSGSDLQNRVDFSASLDTQEHPAVAAGPQGQLVAWSDFQGYDAGTGQAFDIAWAFRSNDGGATTTVFPAPGDQTAVTATSAADAGFLLVWPNGGGLSGAALTAAGTVSAGNLPVYTAAASLGPPAATFDGTQYVVFATNGGFGAVGNTIEAVRVRTDGGIVDTTPRVLFTFTDAGYPDQAAAASNGAGTSLVVATIHGVALSAANVGVIGLMLLPDAGTRGPFYLPATRPARPVADYDGKGFFVAWEDDRNTGVTGRDVYGARVDLTGAVLDTTGVPLARTAGDSLHPALGFNGNVHVVGWQQLPTDGGTWDVLGAVVSTDGGVLGTFAVATDENELEPAAASFGGQTLLAYTRWKSLPPYQANRVFGSVVSWGNGETCSSNADCASGFCVAQGAAHLCCDRACTGSCETCFQTPGSCTPLASTVVCRAADGGCDLTEQCDGVNGTCPADAPQPGGVTCRAQTDSCDVAEACDGVAFTCPPDALADAGTVCQSSTLLCARPAACNGTSAVCPATGVRPAEDVCRPKGGNCDIEEKCDGVSQMCPLDVFAAPTVVCRQKAGECDVEDLCSGNAAACPNDAFAPATTQCRDAMGACDVSEFCTGAAALCPTNGFATAGLVCAPAAADDDCDEPDTCSGAEATCGTNAVKADGTACQGGAGTCQSGVCKLQERSRYAFCGCGSSGLGLFAPLAALAWGARRRRRWLVGLAGLSVLFAVPAFAEAPRLKLVFSGISAGSGVSEDTAKSVAEYVQSELTRIDAYQVVSPSDLAAVLGIERQKQLLGCSEVTGSCMTEVTGALDADRLLRGDLSRIDETIVINLSLVDLRKSVPVGRAGRRLDSGGVSAALREVQPMLYELLNQAPEHQAAPLQFDKGFGGVTVGVRGDADVLAGGVAPGVFAELAGKYLGGVLTVIATATPGARLELRVYPFTTRAVRPYIGAGATVLSTGVGLHGGAGAAIRFGSLQLVLDAAYERFVADFKPGYSKNAVVLGLGLGWNF